MISAASAPALPVWRQFRWRLILSLILLGILPVTLVMAIVLTQTSRQAQQQVFNQLESVATLKEYQVRRWLEGNQAALAFFLSDPVIEQVDAVVAAPDSARQQALSELLGRLAQADSDGQAGFTTLFIYNPAGRILAASNPAFLDRVVGRQPYFAESLSAPRIHPPYYAVGTEELTLMATRPVLRGDRVVAVLAGQLNLEVVGQIMLERGGLGESGETYLVSRENNYLLTPSRFSGYPLNRSYRSQGIAEALQGRSGALIYPNYQQPAVEVQGVYRWLPELQAGLVAEMAVPEAQVAALEVRNIGIALSLGAIAAAVLFGLYTATRVAQPITALTRAAQQIAAGDLGRRVQLRQTNEIGMLADAFNVMAERVQQTQTDLEQRVEARTADLQTALHQLEDRSAAQARLLAEIEQQRDVIREMSVPVLPISDGTLVMPLIGALDTQRLLRVQEQALRSIETAGARRLLLDITGVPVVDSQVAQGLIAVVQAARLLGAEVALVGIRPEVAQTIVGLGLGLEGVTTHRSLQAGLGGAH
ncbi:MAG TPA: cache domain-containing protein [Roseiflexaceae bacterium]|nr:cache domain-containing protein [Roseiflexaceae bacterium]